MSGDWWLPSYDPRTDVPIHRPSVGAMAVTTGSQMPAKITKPYVYRGTGEDQFPETGIDLSPPEPKPKAVTAAEYKERQREVARMKRHAKRRREERWAREARAKARARKRIETAHVPVFLDDLDIEAVEAEAAEDESVVHLSKWRPEPRPSPGWKPLAGADLERLLDE